MDPIAVLTVLVKAQGVAEANAQLEAMNAKGAAAAGAMGKAERAAGSMGGTAAKAAKSVEGAGAAAAATATRTGGLTSALGKAEQAASRAGAGVVSYGKNAEQAGKKLAGVGIGIGVIAGASVDLAVKFQAAMEMIHTQAGAPQKEVDRLRDKVLALAKTLPQSPEELAKGLFHLESVGLRGAKAMDALKVAAEGAAVGHADLEQTATALGSAWLVNIRGAGNLHHVMGLLNATVGAGNMRMEDLVHALGVGLLPAAKNANLGIKDVLAALAIFTDEGYRASSAAAQFSTALHFLTTPTPLAARAFEAMGLKSSQLAEDMQKPNGLLVALKDLKEHLVDAGKHSHVALDIGTAMSPRVLPATTASVRQMQLLNQILPGGQGRIMLTLINQIGRYQQKLQQVSKTSGNFADAVAKTQQTAAFKIKSAWSTLQVVMIKLGGSIMPPLVGLFVAIATAIGKAADAFDSLPGPVRQFIGVFLGVFAAVAAMALLVAKIKEVGAALKLMGLTNPWVLLLVGLVTLAVLVVTHWQQVKKVLTSIWSAIAGAAASAWGFLKSVTLAVWDFILRHLSVIIPAIATLIGGPLGLAVAEIVMHWSAVKGFLVGAWQSIASVASAIWGGIYSVITGVWNALVAVATVTFKVLLYTFTIFTVPIRALIWGTWLAISIAVKAIWSGMRAAALWAWGGISSGITSAVRAVEKFLAPAWARVAKVSTDVWNALKVGADATWYGIRLAIVNPIGKAVNWLAGAWATMKKAAGDAWKAISGTASSVWHSIRDAITGAISDAIGKVKTLIGHGGKNRTGLIGWLAGAWDTITSGIGSFATGVADKVSAAFRGVVNAVIGFVNAIIGVVNKIPGLPDIPKIGKVGAPKKQGHARGGVHGGSAVAQAQAFAHGGAFARTGGLVNRPITLMGEEAPQHPEYVVPTNPAYRGRARRILAAAARAIGLASGGIWSVGELETLWKQAGGPANAAYPMAIVSTAESGVLGRYGNQYARNPSGADGLWQILGAVIRGNLENAQVNARNAVAKFRASGFAPWVSSKPAWGPFLAAHPHGTPGSIFDVLGGAASGAAGIVGDLVKHGASFLLNMLPNPAKLLPSWIRGLGTYALDHVSKFIKDKVAALLASVTGGSAVGNPGVVPGIASGPNGVGSYRGIPMADWVIESLKYAERKLGRPLYPTSGYRPGFDPHTVNGVSEHAGTQYPHGAVDFGGYHDAAAKAIKMAVVASTREFKWPLLAPIGFVDDGHASGTGHKMGGVFGGPFVGSFAHGGTVPRDGFAYVHKGEEVSRPKAGGGGGNVIIQGDLVVRDQADADVVARKLAWALET